MKISVNINISEDALYHIRQENDIESHILYLIAGVVNQLGGDLVEAINSDDTTSVVFNADINSNDEIHNT